MKKFKIAINGFGRIGRLVLRALIESGNEAIEVVAINDLSTPTTLGHLFEYDSVHGRYNGAVEVGEDFLSLGGEEIKLLQIAAPESLPWGEMGVDLVLECSGRFTKREDAKKHLKAGARRVLISAPAVDADRTVVYGVNHLDLTTDDLIISNASCTTNCLAPIAMILDQILGIEKGYMTTIHAYTADQRLVDTAHDDLRRSRAAALSMIPTSTGAAKAVGLVLPQLKGKLDGCAIRVPVPNVSMVDLTFVAKSATTAQFINDAMIEASQGPLVNILGLCDKPLVSADFNHTSFSAVFDTTQTQIVDNTLCRVVAWYDNEWGFANRMVDITAVIAKLH